MKRKTTLAEKIRKAKACCSSAFEKAKQGELLGSLFSRDWQVFVIRRDAVSGEYTTTTLCCG